MTNREFQQLIDRMDPVVRTAFLDWARARVSAANIGEVEALVRAGDVDRIMESLGITEASLSNLTEAQRLAYVTAGQAEATAVLVAFDTRNPAAEAWLRENSSRLVVEVTQSQRAAIQGTLEAGTAAGRNPRDVSRDITGRIDSSTGRRSGGIVGLTGQQAGYASSARAELRSGDPAALRHYLRRQRRDRRYDAAVRRAIAAERPLPVATADRIAGRYADRLLNLRGDTIARTETIAALNAARDQAWAQAVQEGNIDLPSVENEWSATGDVRTRHSHLGLNRQRRPAGEPFVSDLGNRMLRPGDTSLGAGAADLVNCRCHLIKRADFIGQALRRARAGAPGTSRSGRIRSG